MTRYLFLLSIVIISLTACTPATHNPPPPAASPMLVGYFYGLDHHNQISNIPASVSAVLYAFVNVSSTGECVSADSSSSAEQANFAGLRQLKAQQPNLKTLISVGGYGLSTYFSDAALTADSRHHFAQTCVAFMKQNGFDGIDIDWELPVSGGKPGNHHNPADKQNYTLLLAELRSQLDAQGASEAQHYLLSIAAPIGPSEYKNLELSNLGQYLDWFNLEAYAFYTASSPLTNFNAPLYPSAADPTPDPKRSSLNGDAAVQAYLAAGIPASQLVLGLPFYGRGWQGVSDGGTQGLYQSDSGPATDSSVPSGTWQGGAIRYGDLERYYLGYTRYWQSETLEPWLYSPNSGIFITYEDPQSVAAKADYVMAHGLGGIMVWHLSDDDAQHSLVNALLAHLQNH